MGMREREARIRMLKRGDTSTSLPPSAAAFSIMTQQPDERTSVISVEGDLDLSTAPRLKWMLLDSLEAGASQLVVDLSHVVFMDSTALGVLVGVNRSLDQGARMAIVCTHDNIRQIFEFSGTDRAFAIYSTLDDALQHVQGHTAPAG